MRVPRTAVADIFSGALLLGFGVAALVWMIEAHVRVVAGFGADARQYPQILAVLFIVVGASIIIGGIRAWRRPEEGRTSTTLGGSLRVALTIAAGAGFALLAPRVGFVPAATLTVAAFALIAGVRNPLAVGALSVITALVVYFLAARLLGLALPG